MQEKPYERKKLLAVSIIAAVFVVMIILGIVIVGLMNGAGTQPTVREDEAKTLLYDTLGKAAARPQLRIAMYRATYAAKADADASKNIGTEASSVAEVDADTAKWRSVFATNAVDTPHFSIGRCIDGVSYSDDYQGSDTRPTTLQTAADVLTAGQHLYKTSVPLFNPCPDLGLMTGVADNLASFRYSDGVFPVNLTATQANNWKAQVKKADLFTVKDEGLTDYNGRQVRKVSFAPKSDEVNRRLENIFTSAGEVEKIKREHPGAKYRYEFITINPGVTGGVGGYYLIDETTKLPVYSQLYGTNEDRDARKSSSRFNLARTKQTYKFGQALSLTETSPLEILK